MYSIGWVQNGKVRSNVLCTYIDSVCYVFYWYIWYPDALDFLQTNEAQSRSFILQQVSVALQRGNAASVLGTIG